MEKASDTEDLWKLSPLKKHRSSTYFAGNPIPREVERLWDPY
jgi:hypothetical protein